MTEEGPDTRVREEAMRLLGDTQVVSDPRTVTGVALLISHRVDGDNQHYMCSVGEPLGLPGMLKMLHGGIGYVLSEMTGH